MGRQRKDFTRKSGVRDATLFVIATEGEYTEQCYFETLVSKDFFFSTRVHVELIPASDGQSAPNQVMARLDAFKKEYKLRPGDELWMVIDRDRQSWTLQAMVEAQQCCRQKGYAFGLTNPCFEFWLLLHLEDPTEYSPDMVHEILANQKIGRRNFCDQRLLKHLGAYNKTNPDLTAIIPNVQDAIDRNRRLTQGGATDLFEELGSMLGDLCERLIERADK